MKIVAYIVSSIIGFIISYLFFEGAAAAYAAILISYHLYLAFLVVTASHEKSLSMSIGMTFVYHLAFLGLVVGIAYGRAHIPFFFIVRWLVPALAPFETQWLFSGKGKKLPAAEEKPQTMADATIQDHEAFREHMMQPDRPFRKPGISVAEEFNLWLADRQKKKAQAEALAAAALAGSSAGGRQEAGSRQ
jgi:hypothetical protein